MKEFSDLHFTVSGGFTQRSGHYKLTTDTDAKEISVTTRHLEHSGQASDRAFPDVSDVETPAKPAVQGEQNTSHKSPSKNPLASQAPRFTPIERLPGGSKYTESVL